MNLSRTSNIPALYFLLGELPIEAKIHRDIFSLFYGVWSNPDCKIYSIVKYLLENSSENSRTWAIHLRHLCRKYRLSDPLEYLKYDAPSKSQFKEDILTKICAFYENELRTMASRNSRMNYLNVSLIGLRGRRHPALANIVTTREVQKCRIHIKMLSGDFFTYQVKSDQSGGSPHCRCCTVPDKPAEDISHILTSCSAYSEIRNRIMAEFEMCVANQKQRYPSKQFKVSQ